ncbi:hypothetical protein PoB_004771000 [Plakobranchus ocellatus]|uniref:Uncharacterized protein n=1 Tax=Plakobranchus ocellatus TaxID=259542 RepID=A0AAV4BL06_9GAST|nr:hypothetical protein PoB_004771000 [Plakobranchus ocellatus]
MPTSSLLLRMLQMLRLRRRRVCWTKNWAETRAAPLVTFHPLVKQQPSGLSERHPMCLVSGGDEKHGCREDWLAYCDLHEIKSQFTSYRSNRFNNIFENAVAILAHKDDSLHFLQNCINHSNLKLQSICSDLQDQKLLSIIAATSLFSTFVSTPYWKLMNSHVNYGEFPNYVKAMEAAVKRWLTDQFEIDTLFTEEPLFGQDFAPHPDVTLSFWNSDMCQKNLTTTAFKAICTKSLEALQRQLTDFLPGGVYGGDVPEHVQKLLKTCPLTNLTGERLFGDLDYSMIKRRTASTFLHSTVNMWKHNKTSTFLSTKSPTARRKLIDSAKKNGKKT